MSECRAATSWCTISTRWRCPCPASLPAICLCYFSASTTFMRFMRFAISLLFMFSKQRKQRQNHHASLANCCLFGYFIANLVNLFQEPNVKQQYLRFPRVFWLCANKSHRNGVSTDLKNDVSSHAQSRWHRARLCTCGIIYVVYNQYINTLKGTIICCIESIKYVGNCKRHL